MFNLSVTRRCGIIGGMVILAVGCGDSTTGATPGSAGSFGNGNTSQTGGASGAAGNDGGATHVAGAAGAAGATCSPAPASDPNLDPTAFPDLDPALTGQHRFFEVRLKDAESGAPIRGATLTTTNKITLISDDNGVVAFYEPGLMGLSVYFTISHPSYEIAADGFGNRGAALNVKEGESAEVRLTKITGAAAPAQGDLQTRLATKPVPGKQDCLALRAFDAQNKRGVPLVSFKAFGETYWSDSQGIVAYCNPDHVGDDVEFEVFSHGYELSSGGSRVLLKAIAGGIASVELRRTQLAERLYRITGAGIYRDSVLLGLKTPLKAPTLLAQVMGSDTASSTPYKGKLFWLWQDTDRVSYPLGNFRGTAATSLLPAQGGLIPELGVDLTYYTGSDGFAAPMCPDCEGGPTWMAGVVSVPDEAGQEKLFAGYTIVKGDGSPIESGLAVFDDGANSFKRVITNFKDKEYFTRPDGHAFKFWHADSEYVYYGRLRIPASESDFMDPSQYEQFTPYGANGSSTLERVNGSLHYAYRKAGRTVTSQLLEADKVPKDQDLDGHELSFEDGQALQTTGSSVTWNPYRQRFFRIAQQLYGSSSLLGEIWHAEADTPAGPWIYARKIITHQNYTFYNTLYHPELSHGRFAFLEGTYTATYTDALNTPRYNYNQVMHRLDLDDPRLALPVPIYDIGELPGNFATKHDLSAEGPALVPAFLAPDRPFPNGIPVAWSAAACNPDRKLVASETIQTPLFYVLAPNTTPAPPHTVPLYEYVNESGTRAYAVDSKQIPAGFERAPEPLGLVWENPVRVPLPVRDYLGDVRANAGADQCIQSSTSHTLVTLDASGSTSRAGELNNYRWHFKGKTVPCEYIEGRTVSVSLAPGQYVIELQVTDALGQIDTDTVNVELN